MCVAVEIYWYTLDTVQYTSLNSDFVRFIAKSLVLCLYTDCQPGKVFEIIHCHCIPVIYSEHKLLPICVLQVSQSFVSYIQQQCLLKRMKFVAMTQ